MNEDWNWGTILLPLSNWGVLTSNLTIEWGLKLHGDLLLVTFTLLTSNLTIEWGLKPEAMRMLRHNVPYIQSNNWMRIETRQNPWMSPSRQSYIQSNNWMRIETCQFCAPWKQSLLTSNLTIGWGLKPPNVANLCCLTFNFIIEWGLKRLSM